MSKNPFVNSLAATAYIVFVSFIMQYGTKYSGPTDTIVGPMAVLSLFTLSAAVMGYLFVYTPAQLYFENKKKEAVTLFLQTVGIFGVITAIIFAVMLNMNG